MARGIGDRWDVHVHAAPEEMGVGIRPAHGA